jgi:CTP:molybdopterin cytidylyltransferase MocA
MSPVAVLLAAGGGTRFTGSTHKLLAEIDGRPVWRWSLDHLLEAGFDDVVVVTGAAPLELGGLPVHTRPNPDWAEGQATSVQAGLAAAGALGATSAVIGLADQPGVTAAAWRAVADAPPAPIVIATYGGRRGPNPVRLHRDVWPLLPTSGDEGARAVIAEHPDWVTTVACLGSPHDIDTLEDLHRWRSC